MVQLKFVDWVLPIHSFWISQKLEMVKLRRNEAVEDALMLEDIEDDEAEEGEQYAGDEQEEEAEGYGEEEITGEEEEEIDMDQFVQQVF